MIMAYNGTVCPSGWKEAGGTAVPVGTGGSSTLNLRGQFLRGIDPSGSTTVDPSGTRAPGNQQADAFQTHTHTYTTAHGYAAGNTTTVTPAYAPNWGTASVDPAG